MALRTPAGSRRRPSFPEKKPAVSAPVPGHRFELPFVVLCRDRQRGREIVSEGLAALVVGDAELHRLVFATSPRRHSPACS